jgi:hypothetical protein
MDRAKKPGTEYKLDIQSIVKQFSAISRHLILLGPNILLSTLFSNTLSLCSSLNVRDQVSHPYRTIGIIIFLYILIFKYSTVEAQTLLHRIVASLFSDVL